MSHKEVVTKTELGGALPLIARGKVRDVYAVDDQTLLFVATDRISAYDVILKNGIPDKGELLTRLSQRWFELLSKKVPGLKTHFLSLSLPAAVPSKYLGTLSGRSMQVRRLKVFPIEAIVRGYVTGSAWSEYKRTGTVHGIELPSGLQESQEIPNGPLYTPSTKAEAGAHDENIHPSRAAELVGDASHAQRIEELSKALYTAARDYAAQRGIIIADTKFEFALDESRNEVVLADEVLTPDSSRFWPADSYEVGKAQPSFDKQYLRDWLVREGLKGKDGVSMSEEVVKATGDKYREAFERLFGA